MCPKGRFGHRTATGGPGKVAVRKPPETKIPAPSGAQIVFFTIFGVVTTLLSVGRFCKAIWQFGFGTSAFFPIFVLQSAAAGCLGSTEKSGKFILAAKCISCLRCSLRRMAWNMVSYVITARAICAYCYKGFPEPSVG